MARLADPQLIFDSGCPDCGERMADLPLPLPGVEDDFDWSTRDYDSFRLFMMQELASRFPERRRWTAADMEVVIVEVLAAALDRASHAVDRVHAERFLDTAQRPESVRRLLKLIGYDAALSVPAEIVTAQTDAEKGRQIEAYWRANPAAMERARAAGPLLIAEQNRMVTLEDHGSVLEAHPLVALARARLVWTGAWQTLLISVLLEDDKGLDAPLHDDDAPEPAFPNKVRRELWQAVVQHHRRLNLPLPAITTSLTARRILRGLIEDHRMIGTEVFLEPAKSAALNVTLSIRAKEGYFRSELKQALAQVFSADQGGFFEIGRLDFGTPLFASDVIEAAMAVEGVAVACLNLFGRVGRGFEDQSASGVIMVAEDEFIECRSDRSSPESGNFRIIVNGGEAG